MTTTQNPPKSKTITTQELAEGLIGHVVVDVRSSAAYNGWKLNGEVRGGHIPGAVLLPEPWLTGLTDDELRLLLANKGITPDRSVVLYGDSPEQVLRFHQKLTEFGYTDIATYEKGFAGWAADSSLPVESLTNSE
jgi:3-mercaptopyruvate sulfurtransferase SseA